MPRLCRGLLLSRGARIRLAVYAGLLVVIVLGAVLMFRMPGRSHAGPLPLLDEAEGLLRDRLRVHVEEISHRIGERNVWEYENLVATAAYLEGQFSSLGYGVASQEFEVDERHVRNLEVHVTGASRPDQIVLVGGHYDTVLGSPGANDNATGVAALLEIARRFADRRPARTVRFVTFVNEEPPFFQTPRMGSLVYARRAKAQGDRIVAMLSLETIGYYSDADGSQGYPFPFGLLYPRTGNFIGFVGNLASRDLVRGSIESFRRHTHFPSEGVAAPGWIAGIGWSDHWAFWQEGYSAIMVTDTALFRDPRYHSMEDTSVYVDYERLARVVAGLARVVGELAEM